jgi:hypothetical protein
VSVTSDPDTSSGDIFLTPKPSGPPTQGYGLMILNPKGHLVWYHSLGPDVPNNLEVQSYRGQPALTWTQDRLGQPPEDVIANRSYRVLAVVRAGEPHRTDEHEFQITPQGTAWLLADGHVTANLTGVGGPSSGTVSDVIIQEIEIATGKVLWQWDAYQHIPLNASYSPPRHGVYDAYHLNSIQLLPGGNLLVSSRSTWSVYEISIATHRVLWTLGGKYNQFKRGPGAKFEWQHAARMAGSTLTVFDDADSPQEEPQSSAKVIRLNLRQRTATLIHAYDHSPPLLSPFGGNAQRLPNGKLFVGWGGEPDFSEYTPNGRQIFNGTFPLGVYSYRAFRFPWSAQPPGRPDIAASAGPHGTANVWASWNGATNVVAWRVLGGSRASRLNRLITRPDTGFETRIALNRRPRYVEAQALNGRGNVMGTSAVHPVG